MKRHFVAAFACLALGSSAFAHDDSVQNVITDESRGVFAEEERSYSPFAGRNFPTRPLWGDTNSIGAPELIAVWTDPDFDPDQRAFYYARVLETPTPRWTTYDAARYDIGLGPEVPRTTQERAYTPGV